MTDSQQAEKEWVHPTTAKLFHKGKLIGVIRDIVVEDMFQWSGHLD
jgi:hypothetical protein